MKHKDLIGIPWMVAFALRADGWYLRRDVIWAKPNPMPESVEDRPTSSHEYIFLLTKSGRYFFDSDAVRERGTTGPWAAMPPIGGVKHAGANGNATYSGNQPPSDGGRNIRSVWTVATEPYSGAHFATWPRRLVEPMVKAGTSEHGVCGECGAPWERVVERGDVPAMTPRRARLAETAANGTRLTQVGGTAHSTLGAGMGGDVPLASAVTTGWRPTCAHEGAPVPAVVLDPFAGSGTTGLVAQTLGRRAVLIDLNPEYLRQAMARATREFGTGGKILEDDGKAEIPEGSLWASM